MRRRIGLAAVVLLLVAGAASLATTSAAQAAGCSWGPLTQPFLPWNDANLYFGAPGGDFESGASGWGIAGGAGIVAGNESSYVGSDSDNYSLALPTTSSVVTTPTICVTSQSPLIRLFIKNNGNLGHIDGQLAVYLNFTGADGKAQQVKIAALTVKSTSWTLSAPISFIQYVSTPLKAGFAYVSFTLRPNDNHGNWQVDDLYVDPYKTG